MENDPIDPEASTMGRCDDKDVITPVGSLPDGRTLVSRHHPDHSTTMAVIRPVVDGSPMMPGEEYVTTSRRPDGSHEITSAYAPARSGPPQVATKVYRDGWDRTFNAPGGSA
jgi:hypothetical protein